MKQVNNEMEVWDKPETNNKIEAGINTEISKETVQWIMKQAYNWVGGQK